MANPNYQDRQSESKGLFVKTIEFIGSTIALIVFVVILYGAFTGTLDLMLWQLLYKIIDILIPIVLTIGAIGLAAGAVSIVPLIPAFIQSLYMDMRTEKIEWDLEERLQRKPSPTPMLSSQKTATETPVEVKTSETTQSRGEYMMLAIDEGSNGARFEYAYKGTSEYAKLKAQGARDVSVVNRQEVIKSKAQAQNQAEKDEINELANARLKEVQTQVMNPREFKADPGEMEGYNNLIGQVRNEH